MQWSRAEIDECCDKFEDNLRSPHPKPLIDWVEERIAEPPRKLMIELVRVELDYLSSADADLDIAEYLAKFGFTSSDVSDQNTSVTCSIPEVKLASPPSIRSVGRFQVIRELGRGGFGCVYLAHDETLNREVALKVPLAFLEGQARDRFMREAEAAASLDHLGIVPVFDAGEADESFYIASAYCRGENLSQWLKKQEEIPFETCAEIVRCIGEAMQHAHNRGVAHRDLKPGNVMLVPVEKGNHSSGLPFVPRITDFGMAKLVESRMEDTNSSVMLGTPAYMAPEQFGSGESTSPYAADIYAVGVILYELLTSRRPHDGCSLVEVMDAVRSGTFAPPRKIRADLPKDLETICLKCLSRMPENRYESCSDLVDDLSRFIRGLPIKARRSTIREQLALWLRHPMRMYEAGVMSMVGAVGIPTWIAGAMLLLWNEGVIPSLRSEVIPHATGLLAVFFGPILYAGYLTIKGNRWAFWFNLAWSVAQLLVVVPAVFGRVLAFPEVYSGQPVGRIGVYFVLSLFYSTQVMQYILLLVHHRTERRPKPRSD